MVWWVFLGGYLERIKDREKTPWMFWLADICLVGCWSVLMRGDSESSALFCCRACSSNVVMSCPSSFWSCIFWSNSWIAWTHCEFYSVEFTLLALLFSLLSDLGKSTCSLRLSITEPVPAAALDQVLWKFLCPIEKFFSSILAPWFLVPSMRPRPFL